jgi:hypothetical protein
VSGRHSRNKGSRNELALVKFLQAHGIAAEKVSSPVPISASRFSAAICASRRKHALTASHRFTTGSPTAIC